MTQKNSPGSSEETIGAVLLALEDKDTCRKALQFAKTRCATLRQMGIGADPSDLVQGVIADTLSGDLSWRPEACALASHLIGAIRSRTHKLRTRSREFLNRNEQPDGPTRHPEPQLLASDVWARIRETLLSRATEAYDDDVSYVLMAFDDGVHKTEAICQLTQLSADAVKNAKRRIRRMIADLPKDLVEAANCIGAET